MLCCAALKSGPSGCGGVTTGLPVSPIITGAVVAAPSGRVAAAGAGAGALAPGVVGVEELAGAIGVGAGVTTDGVTIEGVDTDGFEADGVEMGGVVTVGIAS
jgi:hypothetical protein